MFYEAVMCYLGEQKCCKGIFSTDSAFGGEERLQVGAGDLAVN